jgi:radical SAM protein with 4Fe4S-binding SPASM domain
MSRNLDPVDFARFVNSLFDSWLERGDPEIRIGFFDHFFQGMTGRRPVACYLSGRCTTILGVGPGGTAIPCTRPFDSRFRFGDLTTEPLTQVLESEAFRSFAAEEAAGRERAESCEWGGMCAAGCPHERVANGAQSISGDNVFCTCGTGGGGYPAIFEHMRARTEAILMAEATRPHLSTGRRRGN